MTYHDSGRQTRLRTDSPSSSSRRIEGGGRARVPSQGHYHGPTGTRSRGNGLKGGRRGGGRGGYPLKSRSINFQPGRGRMRTSDRRLLILGALAIVLVILVVVGISSCVRSCSSEPQQTTEVNSVDARVAVGVPEELTRRFAEELDVNEALSQIAARANEYDDQGLLELALEQRDAVEFVAAYPDAEKVGRPYEDSVSAGTAPQLYCWDSRWGNVEYAGHALALSGSGPTVLSMAYMGLTDSSDKTPADIAALAAEASLDTGDSLMSADFVSSAAESLGLTYASYSSNVDNLSHFLDTGTYLVIEAKAGTLSDDAHWVLLVSENGDGTVNVYDPTSPDVSSRTWTPDTLAAACDTLYVLSTATE